MYAIGLSVKSSRSVGQSVRSALCYVSLRNGFWCRCHGAITMLVGGGGGVFDIFNQFLINQVFDCAWDMN